jgi:cell division protease FtsH
LAYAKSSRKKACILFIDEIDSMAAKRRTDGSNDIMQRLTNMLLETIDKTADKKLCIIGATNIPQVLAAPVQNRLGRRIYFPIPDLPTREKIFTTYLEKFAPEYSMTITDDVMEQLHTIAQTAQGLVGRDIEDVVRGSYDYADGRDEFDLTPEHLDHVVQRKLVEGSAVDQDTNLALYL